MRDVTRHSQWPVWWAPFWVAALIPAQAADRSSTAGNDFFESRIRPVLVERCYRCHSAESEKLKGGLRLDTAEGTRQGGESGLPSVVPGNPGRSRLIEAIRYQNEDLQMPPKEKLADSVIADFTAWIAMGAPDPRTNRTAQVPVASGANHWAFQPPGNPPVPPVADRAWVQTPIDAFILAKLEAHGLGPSPPADRRTLLRRAWFDLIGLPPAPGDVEAFLGDSSPEAFPRAVDRLLASPGYGEHWGRFWLDLARYSDTKGYVYDREEKRFVHSHAYRDWVVRAFNQDLPYDEFIMRQLAADQLIGSNPGGATQADLAAMGFLTVGRRFLGIIHDIIDDRIDVASRGLLGLTVACARCHDHKYDPVSTRDYYSLYGVLLSSTEKTARLPAGVPATPAVSDFESELAKRVEKLEQTFQKKRSEVADRLRTKAGEYLLAALDVSKLPGEEFYTIMGPDDLNPVVVRQWDAYLFRTRGKSDPVFAPWHAFRALPENDFGPRSLAIIEALDTPGQSAPRLNRRVTRAFAEHPPNSMRAVAEIYGALLAEADLAWRKTTGTNGQTGTVPGALPDPDLEAIRQVLYGPDSPARVPPGSIAELEFFFDEKNREELAKLQAEIDRWIITAPGAPPYATYLEDRAQPRNARVLVRGNPAQRGDEVPRQFLAALSGPDQKPFQKGSGRLELARAIANPDNPLTARVLVNRVWQQHFGAGLVRTPSDFGTRSEPPSHPELLDWLARRFIAEGWSIKKLHRWIMLSSVYQQDSRAAAPGAAALDPENRLLWKMNGRRLEFEAMRDSFLAVSGGLDPVMGGKGSPLFQAASNRRRTIYGFIDRQFLPGIYRVFDFANPDAHSPQRHDTTVPQQALFFMNAPFVIERARALAQRIDRAGNPQPRERIAALYQALFQRPPTPRQFEAGLRYLRDAAAEPPRPPPPPPLIVWQYGYGEIDEATQQMKNFAVLPHFTGQAWQGGPQWPDPKLGWAQLTAEGGHAGNDLEHAAVRRWIAPADGTIAISGTLEHVHKEGDGVRGRIISSRIGQVGAWTVHNQKHESTFENLTVHKGDTIDFVVDRRDNLNSDDFKWAPVIKLARAAGPRAADLGPEWNAKKDFSGPPEPPPPPLTPLEQYAQVLLLSNEFVFID